MEDRFSSWVYNVIDEFKSLSQQEIKQQLKRSSHEFAVLMENWNGDFNLASLIRNANGFNAKEVFYLGRKKYDRRGTVGTHHYIDVLNIKTVEELLLLKEKYVFVGLENNNENSKPLFDFEWPINSLLLFGEEGIGLSKEVIDICDHIIYIPMFGSVRSFNAATASGIAMYDYISKLR